jgi:hypothetical protein
MLMLRLTGAAMGVEGSVATVIADSAGPVKAGIAGSEKYREYAP